jgi:hypothetical protein
MSFPNAKEKIIKSLYLRELTFTEIQKETTLSKPVIAECLKDLETENIIEKSDKETNYKRNRKYKLMNNKMNEEFLRKQLIPFTLYYNIYISIENLIKSCTSNCLTFDDSNHLHINANIYEKNLKEIFIPELVTLIGDIFLIGIYSKNNRETILQSLDYLILDLEELLPELENDFNFDLGKEHLCKRFKVNDFDQIENSLKDMDFDKCKEAFWQMVSCDIFMLSKLNKSNKKYIEHQKKKYKKLGFPFINFYEDKFNPKINNLKKIKES